ncbi:MAG: hypothetical protein ACFFDW_10730 [Candidatus Thorarchaeota archaeon]
MKTLGLYWGYLIGEEHITEEQFAQIDFGNPNFDTEFILFDPLASSYFQGKYFRLSEKKFYFPHRTLPSMKAENMIVYEETNIKIIDPPVDLEAPVGIFLCFFIGKSSLVKKAIEFLGSKINIRFSPCDLDLEKFYTKLSKTRFEIIPKSITIGDIPIDEFSAGNLEVLVSDDQHFKRNMKTYKPKVQKIKLQLKEVNFQFEIEASINSSINIDKEIENLNLLETLYDVASRSVYSGIE